MTASVTQRLAEWIVEARYEDIPQVGVERVRERVLDSLGVQLGGMSVQTGQILAAWIRAQGARGESTVVGGGFKTTAAFAALANASSGHALEFDDIAPGSGHYANPLTATSLAVAEKVGASGKDMILAWMVGNDVTARTARLSQGPRGHELLVKGWFNQGFQPALGAAAIAAKLLKLDVRQTAMVLGQAATGMAGMIKNRGSDSKSYVAGNASMQGVIAAELISMGFTANDDIIEGDIGLASLIGFEGVDPQVVLAGLGQWDMVERSSTLRLHACCGASHFSQDALQQLLKARPTAPGEIESITVEISDFLMTMMPYHAPETGLQAKYSLEYDLAAIALDGKAGFHEYSDAAVQRPEAREMMRKVAIVSKTGGLASARESRVVVKLKNGEVLEGAASRSHGSPADPLTRDEILGKFNDCASGIASQAERDRILELCLRLESVANVRELAEAVSFAPRLATA